jgi:hypothetical protein
MIKKAILQDLNDIKAAVEKESTKRASGPPETNLESWHYIHRFIDMFADDDHWSKWKTMARGVVGALEERGLAPVFRIGQSMHDIILSTSERHGLAASELRVKLEFLPDEQVVRVTYGPGKRNIEERVASSIAVPCVLNHLRRLWSETKPSAQMPDALKST